MSQNDESGLNNQTKVNLATETCYIHITGMSCASCISKIEDTITKQPGIQNIQIALLTEKAEVQYNPEHLIPSQIVTQIQNLGFGAKIIGNRFFVFVQKC